MMQVVFGVRAFLILAESDAKICEFDLTCFSLRTAIYCAWKSYSLGADDSTQK